MMRFYWLEQSYSLAAFWNRHTCSAFAVSVLNTCLGVDDVSNYIQGPYADVLRIG